MIRYGKRSKVFNTFLFLFSNSMLVIMDGAHKMLVRIKCGSRGGGGGGGVIGGLPPPPPGKSQVLWVFMEIAFGLPLPWKKLGPPWKMLDLLWILVKV